MLLVNNTPNDIIISLRFIYINKLPLYVFFAKSMLRMVHLKKVITV